MILAALLFIRRVAETTTVAEITDDYIRDSNLHSLHRVAIPPYVRVFRIHGPFLFGAIDKLHAAIAKIIQSQDVRERILGMGADPVISTPAEFSAFIAAELKKWTKVIKDSGARMD